MLECSIKKNTPKEHLAAAGKPAHYRETMVSCPLFSGKQICLWCCLHICDIATPLNRGDYMINHPEYAGFVTDESNRDWDEVWQVCSRCSTG